VFSECDHVESCAREVELECARAELTAARVPNTFSVFDGSHLPSFYRSHLPLALQVASRRLKTTAQIRRGGRRAALPTSCLPSLQR